MQDYEGLTEGAHTENPVFDVEVANAALARVNLYLDSKLHVGNRNDAMQDQSTSALQSGQPGAALFDEFVDGLITRLTARGLSDDAAIELVGRCADEWHAQDMIDPIPMEDDPDIAYSMWVGQAQSTNFGAYCLEMADD